MCSLIEAPYVISNWKDITSNILYFDVDYLSYVFDMTFIANVNCIILIQNIECNIHGQLNGQP